MKVIFDMQTFQLEDELLGEKKHYFSIIKSLIKEGLNRGHDVIVLLNGSYPQTAYKIQSALADFVLAEKILTWHGMVGLSNDKSISKLSENINVILWNDFVGRINPDSIYLFYFNISDAARHPVSNLVNKAKVSIFLYSCLNLSGISESLIKFIELSNNVFVASEFSKKNLNNILNINNVVNIGFTYEYQKVSQVKLINTIHSEVLDDIEEYIFCYYTEFDDYSIYLNIIKAYSFLSNSIRRKYKIVIGGYIGSENRKELWNYIDFCGLSSFDVVLLDGINEYYFEKLCMGSIFTCFVSTKDGFWSPIVEAMFYGAPVVAAKSLNLSGIPSHYFGLFDNFDAQNIKDKFIDLIENTDHLKSLSMYSKECADRYSINKLTNMAWLEMEDKIVDPVTLKRLTFGTNHNKILFFYNLIKNIVNQDVVKKVEFPNYKKVSEVYDAHVNKHKIKNFIYIDVTNLVIYDHGTGIQRVSRNLLREYTERPPKGFDVLPVYCDSLDDKFKVLQFYSKKNELIRKIDDPLLNIGFGDIFIGCDLNFNLANNNYIDVFRSSGAHVYIVVYDLLPLLLPVKYFSQKMSNDYSRWIKAVSHATGLMCISKTVADELVSFLPAIGDQNYNLPLSINFFPMGVDFHEVTASISEDMVDSLNLQLAGRVSFLMVGTIEPRKGYMQALSAFNQLWREGVDVNLVIVGKKGWGMELFERIADAHDEKDKRFFWFRNLNDAELQQMYKLSDCLIAASEGEGYGLPIIEAGFFKKPVIARDIPVFREVAGTYTRFFSRKSPVDSLISEVKSFLLETLPLYEHEHTLNSWKDSANILWSRIKSEQNYATYMRDRSIVIPVGNSDIDSPCEDRTPLCLSTKHCESSYVMVGPNITINKGTYEVKITGEIIKNFFGHIEIVVYAGFGEKALCHRKLITEVENQILFQETIVFENTSEGVGVRIVMHGRSDMVIRAVSYIPL